MAIRPRETNVIPAQPVSGSVVTTPAGNSIQITTQVYGPPQFFAGEDTTVPGGTQDLITIMGVTAPSFRYLAAVRVTCAVEGKFTVLLNGDKIMSGFIRQGGPGYADYVWPAARPILEFDAVVVTYTSSAWTPSGADVEAYLVVGDLEP